MNVERWFAENGRDLPWRDTRDPWAIVVAEMMLQQTQVARVVERWHRFLRRFPTVVDCARASTADVIDEWSGLGYNRRAVFLHRLAQAVTDDHDGEFPRELTTLLALPGIGQYTARAVRVFAFEQPEAVLDTNVARILARTGGHALSRSQAQAAADANLGEDPWVWNQAMLDIGARFCTARKPDCAPCPLRPGCAWSAAGLSDPDPAAGSAGVSKKQSTFAGSDREGRGRLVRALRTCSVDDAELAAVMGWPGDAERARTVAATVVADGLAVHDRGSYRLPDGG